jgi:hypothetical protein
MIRKFLKFFKKNNILSLQPNEKKKLLFLIAQKKTT